MSRSSRADIIFQGVDITKDVSPYLLSATYTDNEDGETDDLQIKLQDRDGIWLENWLKSVLNAAAGDTGNNPPPTAQNAQESDSARVTARSGLILRAGPSTSTARLTVAPNGSIVTVTDHSGDWWACEYDGKTGYMYSRWLQIDEAAVQPATATASAATAKVTARSGLILRAGKSKSTRRLGAAPYGTEVTVTDQSGSWWAVIYAGQTGYMYSGYLQITSSANGEQTAAPAAGKVPFYIQVLFHRLSWMREGTDEVLDSGTFELDAVECSGPPSQITIKGTSLPYSAPIRQTKKTKAWEKYMLSGIATEMAQAAGMSVQYMSGIDPMIAREEQTDESDIEFLSRVAHLFGLSVKATNKSLVIFDQVTYEALPSVLTVNRGDGSYTKYKISTSTADTQYDSCRVRYTTPQGTLIEGIAKVSDYDAEAKQKEIAAAQKATQKKPTGKKSAAAAAKEQQKAIQEAQKKEAQQLEVWYAVKDVAEAKAIAEKMLRMHNKFSKTASFTFPGNPALVAAANMDIRGFGPWDGKYVISQAKHQINPSSGYTTQVTLRNTLENY
jgi:phage protein D/uncharacterized protein YraI